MIESKITQAFVEIFKSQYGADIHTDEVKIQKTRPEIVGDFTINVFPFLKASKLSPEVLAENMGLAIKNQIDFIESYNIIKGFLNFVLKDDYWIQILNSAHAQPSYGFIEMDSTEEPILIEYSSPNTNKPLHLGHIRNNLLGYSIAQILKASGRNVKKVNLVNDRGIHICKSMLAWERWGEGETPDSTQMKGDHFVGKYYVLFDQYFKEEIKNLVDCGTLEENASKNSILLRDAQKMLKMWEDGDKYVTKLWLKMNEWVCSGFEKTYKKMGIDFDKVYYESDTYLLGKEMVRSGFEKGILFEKEDGSIWADLTDEGLDEKLLLRADGTSVYMTQDLGTADLRFRDFQPQKMLYVVGNEQNYHFDVLKLILKKLGYPYWNDITHISYGMVELPEGKMKSREGTVVDADDLMDEMIETAKQTTIELGKAAELSDIEQNKLFEQVGLGALKYFILKVDPKKTMLFNPKESIDFNGNTGPFIQYTHARIRSLIGRAMETDYKFDFNFTLAEKERDLIILISEFPEMVQSAANQYSPALISNFIFSLAKEYNQFYHDFPVLKEANADQRKFRLELTETTGKLLKLGMSLLGMEAPERM
jgi:arginyl-tRNA synthetase